MNSYQRVMSALSGNKPDRIPVFLFFTIYGAKEAGCSIKEYLNSPAKIVEGQKRLLEKYSHDCLYPFTSAAMEATMFGQGIEYYDDGPPNAGTPIIEKRQDIFNLIVPEPENDPAAKKVLHAVETLAKEYKNKVPIISAVIAPFSMPIILMGMRRWVDLFIDEDTQAINTMIDKTSSFCIRWANLLFSAGADALGFFEPFASTTIITRDEFIKYVFEQDKNTISQIKGPLAFCAAGGRIEPIIDRLSDIGTAAFALSADDDLEKIRKNYGAQINILGNLNNIEMIEWDYEQAKEKTTRCLEQAGRSSRFILSDQHGEISWDTSHRALEGIMDAVRDFRL